MKKFLFLLLFIPLFSRADSHLYDEDNGFDNELEPTVVQRFDNVSGRTIELLNYSELGISCPGGVFAFRHSLGETASFGTCSETIDVRQRGDKIIVTMSGYQYASLWDDEKTQQAAEKAAKEIWQYTYQNGKLTEKQLH